MEVLLYCINLVNCEIFWLFKKVKGLRIGNEVSGTANKSAHCMEYICAEPIERHMPFANIKLIVVRSKWWQLAQHQQSQLPHCIITQRVNSPAIPAGGDSHRRYIAFPHVYCHSTRTTLDHFTSYTYIHGRASQRPFFFYVYADRRQVCLPNTRKNSNRRRRDHPSIHGAMVPYWVLKPKRNASTGAALPALCS